MSAYRIGELVGGLIGAALVVAIIVAIVDRIASRSGKPRSGKARALTAVVTLVVLLLLYIARIAGPDGSFAPVGGTSAISPEERGALLVGTDSIRHTSLGFSLPHPGPGFTANPDLQARMDSAFAKFPDATGWVFSNADRAESLIIQATRFARLLESSFREFTDGLRKGAMRSGATTVLVDTVVWRGDRGEFVFSLRHSAGMYLKTRCLTRPGLPGAVVICVQSTSGEAEGLDAARAGLTVSGADH